MSEGLALIEAQHACLDPEETNGETHEDNWLGEAAGAASSYAWAAQQQIGNAPVKVSVSRPHQSFRWPNERWRPHSNPIDNLARCGAYCAAEIDRLLAEEGGMRTLTRSEVEEIANGMISRIIEQNEDVIGNALADAPYWAEEDLPALYDWLETALSDCSTTRLPLAEEGGR